MDILNAILDAWLELTLWLIGFAVVFGALSKIMPCNPTQPFIREDMPTDIAYSFIVPILGRFMRLLYMGFGVYLFFRAVAPATLDEYILHGFGPLAQMPIWLQAAIIFLVSDLLLYWTHRWFHTKNMWPFHAIHHSTQHVDWLSTYRFHPVNVWLSFTLVDSIMLLIGFSPAAVGLMAGFNTAYSAMVHANLNWTFGPFKYLFASPVFHRWHHTAQEEGMDKNFAPTFPLLDIVFGTFYMPQSRVPERYGVTGSDIPVGFAPQMIWPFKELARQRKKN
jgi:sterol desaturase/sphingolipid hydroxylase (fatty acid hydroxylase superfamily)